MGKSRLAQGVKPKWGAECPGWRVGPGLRSQCSGQHGTQGQHDQPPPPQTVRLVSGLCVGIQHMTIDRGPTQCSAGCFHLSLVPHQQALACPSLTSISFLPSPISGPQWKRPLVDRRQMTENFLQELMMTTAQEHLNQRTSRPL